MKCAGDRHHKQKLEFDDGLKKKIKRVTSRTILSKEKKRGGGNEGKKTRKCKCEMCSVHVSIADNRSIAVYCQCFVSFVCMCVCVCMDNGPLVYMYMYVVSKCLNNLSLFRGD